MALGKLRYLLYLLVFVYITLPVVFKYSPFVQRSLLFMNHANTRNGVNLSHPEEAGINCSRTLLLTHPNILFDATLKQKQSELIQLGAWHILPNSSVPLCTRTEHNNRTFMEDERAFSVDSRPIVLYIHGNNGNRAGRHRSRLYKRLAYEHDYHVVTFDYRGFGDSTDDPPSTFGLTSDARFMYDWLLDQARVTRDRVLVWGHSLGTAVAVRMVADLAPERQPARLILEAPFDSLANAIANHPFAKPFRVMPYFEHFFIDPIRGTPGLNFDSTERIGDITQSPILIMHAQDDAIIAHKLGENLYKVATQKLAKQNGPRVKFFSIAADLNLGHKHICDHNETMLKVKHFIDTPDDL